MDPNALGAGSAVGDGVAPSPAEVVGLGVVASWDGTLPGETVGFAVRVSVGLGDGLGVAEGVLEGDTVVCVPLPVSEVATAGGGLT